METVILKFKNKKVHRLLADLEKLNLVEIVSRDKIRENSQNEIMDEKIGLGDLLASTTIKRPYQGLHSRDALLKLRNDLQ